MAKAMKFRREQRVSLGGADHTVLSDAVDGTVVLERDMDKELITVAAKDRKTITAVGG